MHHSIQACILPFTERTLRRSLDDEKQDLPFVSSSTEIENSCNIAKYGTVYILNTYASAYLYTHVF